ncbi:MAG: glycosyltransferase [Clostridia bacterium]|nr:glycosyltransferase [Clostridia bacterium]
MKNFDFELEPGKELKEKKFKKNNPEISVITPYYNGKKYIEQTVKSVLNQTYPYFEMLIIDDGSTDEESLKKLEEIEKLDERITVIHKQNEGLSATRDYGASKASKNTKYFMFIDDDDLVEPTFLECAYWTLETNKDASWAYSDSLGFDGQKYTWNKWFDSEKMKKINDLVVLALIRKEAYFEVNGYELREKAVNEDWNFWLKLIAKGRYPVHMSFYGEWYRRKEQGELARATQNRKRALEIINNTSKTVKKRVTAIQYPKKDYKYELLDEKKSEILVPEKNNNGKINILMIFPWMVTGGADKFNLELVKRLNKDEFNIVIILTEPNVNNLRQEFEQYSTVYDLTSFLNQENWLSFVNYIMEKEQINLIFNTNSTFGYSILPYLKAKNPTIPILDYVHMEE